MFMNNLLESEKKYLPSKSTVPDPSVSISAMMPSKSLELSLSSRAARISFRVEVVMYPFPSRSYNLEIHEM